jgi:hypothetical protein
MLKGYWGKEQEDAVVKYLESDCKDERSKIFNEFLKKPLKKMTDSIIRRYKLYRSDFTYDEIHDDAISFLVTKMDKFKPEKNKKSYSYFGTIIKRHLIVQINKLKKSTKINSSYEDISPSSLEFMENEREELQTETLKINHGEIMIEVFKNLSNVLCEKIELEQKNMTNEELKVGYALIDIFDNWEHIQTYFLKNNKYNKNLIFEYIRNMTELNTKQIRDSLKYYKDLYNYFKTGYFEERDYEI